MTPHEFQAKWSRVSGTERQTYQEHFRDLCALLHQPTPSAADASGLTYTFEKQVIKSGGGTGFDDVWKRGHFGWEYKGDRKDLDAAYTQLLSYKDALENPPLLVVSDTKRIRIHTNFPNTAKRTYEIGIDQITDPQKLAWLTWLFTEPELLRPDKTADDVTREATERHPMIRRSIAKTGRGGRGFERPRPRRPAVLS